jgi:hypothetical protein
VKSTAGSRHHPREPCRGILTSERQGRRRGRILALVAGLVVACGRTGPDIEEELRNYLTRTESWRPAEAEAAGAVRRILRTEFVDAAEVYHEIAASRPRVIAHLRNARAYKPRAKMIADLHQRYIRGWVELLAAYAAIEDGLDAGDSGKLARGRQAIEAWRGAIVGVADGLREMMGRVGVDMPGGPERPRG